MTSFSGQGLIQRQNSVVLNNAFWTERQNIGCGLLCKHNAQTCSFFWSTNSSSQVKWLSKENQKTYRTLPQLSFLSIGKHYHQEGHKAQYVKFFNILQNLKHFFWSQTSSRKSKNYNGNLCEKRHRYKPLQSPIKHWPNSKVTEASPIELKLETHKNVVSKVITSFRKIPTFSSDNIS